MQVTIDIPSHYLQIVSEQEIQTALMHELDNVLLEKFGRKLSQAIQQADTSLDEISKEAKKQAWEQEKHKHLAQVKNRQIDKEPHE